MNTSSREYPDRPIVGIGIIVLRRDPPPGAVLLIRRAHPPAEGAWSLPGGAQELGETAEAAARRELAEETGLTTGALHLAAHADSIHADQDGRIRYHYTILDFCTVWAGGDPVAGDDAACVAWAPLDRLADYDLVGEIPRVIGLARARLL